MKKICLGIVILLGSLSMHSQEISKGFTLGLGAADATGFRQYNSSFSYSINARFGMELSEKISIFIEPGYVRKGYSFPVFIGHAVFQNNYIQLPILLDISPLNKFSVYAGPEISYLLSAKIKSGNVMSDNLRHLHNQNGFSAVVGMRYSISDTFDIGIRGSHEILPFQTIIATDEMGNKIGELKMFQRYLQATIGYTF